ncbi:hypothetical protein R1flu_014380 [Riccia fluitans]|uniref:Uncharacterized protein n=1 Tax=Riccia fluitans TaxID=41844 RepID=A0ABD1YJB5_9MARC
MIPSGAALVSRLLVGPQCHYTGPESESGHIRDCISIVGRDIIMAQVGVVVSILQAFLHRAASKWGHALVTALVWSCSDIAALSWDHG